LYAQTPAQKPSAAARHAKRNISPTLAELTTDVPIHAKKVSYKDRIAKAQAEAAIATGMNLVSDVPSGRPGALHGNNGHGNRNGNGHTHAPHPAAPTHQHEHDHTHGVHAPTHAPVMHGHTTASHTVAAVAHDHDERSLVRLPSLEATRNAIMKSMEAGYQDASIVSLIKLLGK
jgi:hypothetical protein